MPQSIRATHSRKETTDEMKWNRESFIMIYEIDDDDKEIVVVAVGSHKIYG